MELKTKKPVWYYSQSGAIPYRLIGGEFQVLLITTRGRKRWIVPKGIVEQSLSPAESALQEAYEEAGVKGRIQITPMGGFQFEKWGGTRSVTIFPLAVEEVLDKWPESKVRQRKWVSIQSAQDMVDEPDLKRMIAEIPSVAESKVYT